MSHLTTAAKKYCKTGASHVVALTYVHNDLQSEIQSKLQSWVKDYLWSYFCLYFLMSSLGLIVPFIQGAILTGFTISWSNVIKWEERGGKSSTQNNYLWVKRNYKAQSEFGKHGPSQLYARLPSCTWVNNWTDQFLNWSPLLNIWLTYPPYKAALYIPLSNDPQQKSP